MVADRYLLAGEIGRGGMASVWLAEDRKLGRQVALKVMAKSLAEVPGIRERFEREAKAVAGLRSAHIVEVYDYGVHRRVPFLVMELLEGESLRERIRRVRRLSLSATAGIVAQMAKGLGTAHRAGLVHRDLKPGNIFIALRDEVEVVRLLDFGVVKAIDDLPSGMTRTGALLGTPPYMSPEQLLGAKGIDRRSDLWSFAVVVFQLLTGCNPFDGETPADVALKIHRQALPSVVEFDLGLPDVFDAFFQQALSLEPSARFDNVDELAGAFWSAAGLSGSHRTTTLGPAGAVDSQRGGHGPEGCAEERPIPAKTEVRSIRRIPQVANDPPGQRALVQQPNQPEPAPKPDADPIQPVHAQGDAAPHGDIITATVKAAPRLAALSPPKPHTARSNGLAALDSTFARLVRTERDKRLLVTIVAALIAGLIGLLFLLTL